MMLNKISNASVASCAVLKQLGGKRSSFSTAVVARRSRLFANEQQDQANGRAQPRSQLFMSAPSHSNASDDPNGPPANGLQRLETNFLARQFIQSLTASERVVIKQELVKFEQEQALLAQGMAKNEIKKPTVRQLLTGKHALLVYR
jgi:hypothetical protein